ncbi:MAG: LamG-like jellyroll fold domain-containing protein [Porphyromonadaceae bacterium]|nr:LamG-like jellyroll fold domain-containing protein [Porphyromonadaceae bacterium]
MKTKKVLCLGFVSMLMATTALNAQSPTEYLKWTETNGVTFGNAYRAWTPGQPLYANQAEDENFFISRIKPKERFTHAATQVDPALVGEKDKHVLNWLPIGKADGGNPNALPSGIFDSDVFSMWNYVTHYGNWTAPMIRVPGAFMDVVHKNGVTTSALASIPYGLEIRPGDNGHGSNLNALVEGGADKMIQFLKYYGVDGWGMNSEFSTTENFARAIQEFMGQTYQKAVDQKKHPSYSAVYYSLVSNRGRLVFGEGLTTQHQSWFRHNGKNVTNYYFSNYNWGNSELAENDRLSKQLGRDPRDVYAGMDMQGRGTAYWTLLKNYGSSIGLWGAHNMSMFYESRNERGSHPDVQQNTLLGRTERFYTNGHQNPARKIGVSNMLTYSYERLKGFHGISAMASAKSVLNWDLGKMPFYSFFNLGNGRFFNVGGKQVSGNEWYNIAMQDYLPTWRYWFAPSFLGREVNKQDLSATFVWDDAWFGGSCMQVSGTTDKEYLHLFKTKFELKDGDKVRIRYKVTSGAATLSLVASAEGTENTEVAVKLVDAAEVDLGVWQEKEITVASAGRNALRLAGQTMAMLGLKFEGAQNLEVKIGELSIYRGAVEKPAAPQINTAYTKLLKHSFRGLDAKIIFSMAEPAGHTAGETVYNEDVKTSFFKVYIKQGEGEPKFVTATTSWAALCFAAPYDKDMGNKVRLGVAAVGLDGVTESDITWTDELEVRADLLKLSERVLIDKPIVKPEQQFTVSLEDPNQPEATWEVIKGTDVVHRASGKSFSHKFTATGLYDVKATLDGGKVVTVPGLIQVSPESVGAYPEIQTLTFNAQTDNVGGKVNEANNLVYTGRNANGSVSRGLNLKESPMATRVSEIWPGTLPQSGKPNYTLSFWVKFNSLVPGENGINLLNIRNPKERWPKNNWGHIWSEYHPATQRYDITHRGAQNNHQKNTYALDLKVGVWTHFAYVFRTENNSQVYLDFYVNGTRVPTVEYGDEHGGKKEGDKKTPFVNVHSLPNSYWIMFGGNIFKRSGVDGVMDDIKIYKKALSADEVAKIVYDTNPFQGVAKEDLAGFWDFEGDPEPDFYFKSPETQKRLAIGGLKQGSGEGEADFVPFEPAFEAGSPFISGSKFKIETTAKWVFPGGQVATKDADNTDRAGKATVTYKKTGVYTGKLILQNSWGKDERVINVINIINPGSVEDITDEVSLTAFPNPFVETVNVRFATAGNYQIGIYDLSGTLVSRQTLSADAGSVVTVNLNAPAGLYLMRVMTAEGKLLQTLKLQKK